MTIFRVQKKENYVVLDKGFLNDTKLSWQAKGLLAYMLSLPNDWTFSVKDLSTRSKNGRDATNTIVKELCTAGYIRKQQKRAEKGKFSSAELLVFETPLTENPSTEYPSTEKPFSDSPQLLNNKLLNNKKDIVEKNLDLASEVINYLNQKTSKNFKATSSTTQKLINGRVNDGYTLEDFKRVIDIKSSQWLKTEMNIYLRPNTLFNSTNFENYLNENTSPRVQQTSTSTPVVPQPIELNFNAGEDF